MIKDIVVNLSASNATIDFAISVAKALRAHLAGVSFLYESIILPTSDMGGIPIDYIEAQCAQNEQNAKKSKARFDEAARLAGISSESCIIKVETAEASDTFARIARRFDMSILSQADPNKNVPNALIIEGALFGSGRPLFVPYVQKTPLTLDRAMVCWDGSRNAARAVSDALPLLARVKHVNVVTMLGENGKSDELLGADIVQHLVRHGLDVELRRVSLSGRAT